ncbi:MAG: DUF882 domain-containing protein [Sandaracinus sp.]
MPEKVTTLLVLAVVLATARPARADLTVVFFGSEGSDRIEVADEAPAAAPSEPPAAPPREAREDPPVRAEPAVVATPAEMQREEPAPVAPAPSVAPESVAPIRARFVRVGDGSGESETLLLRDENGAAGEGVLARLSLLARPRGTDVPGMLDESDPEWIAPGIRRLDAGLLPLVTRLAEHFPDHAIEIVSGYRPNARSGSRHRFGRALDLRIEGVSIEEIRTLLDDEPYAGIGVYPTSGFVHVDVRAERVRWTDDSGPGEPTHVVVTEVGTSARTESPSTPAAPDDAPVDASSDAASDIERALRSADGIVLDLGPLAP